MVVRVVSFGKEKKTESHMGISSIKIGLVLYVGAVYTHVHPLSSTFSTTFIVRPILIYQSFLLLYPYTHYFDP
jgi:hypothetical protein